jgi:hypothetical protein
MKRINGILLIALTVWAAAPLGAAQANKKTWQAVADRFAKTLPKPLARWTSTKTTSRVIHSAFQKEIYAKRTYRPTGTGKGMGPQVQIIIGAAPDWKKPPWRLKMETDPALAKKSGFKVIGIKGRIFLVRRKGENVTYVTHVDRRITVLFAGKWVKAAQVESLLWTVDYVRLAKVR